MTSPANKRRTHNADARAVALKSAKGGVKRPHNLRNSPYGRKLAAKRKEAAQPHDELPQPDESQ